jgi:hypothetical protein
LLPKFSSNFLLDRFTLPPIHIILHNAIIPVQFQSYPFSSRKPSRTSPLPCRLLRTPNPPPPHASISRVAAARQCRRVQSSLPPLPYSAIIRHAPSLPTKSIENPLPFRLMIGKTGWRRSPARLGAVGAQKRAGQGVVADRLHISLAGRGRCCASGERVTKPDRDPASDL